MNTLQAINDPLEKSEDPERTFPLGVFTNLEHETGLEPATPTLATWRSTN